MDGETQGEEEVQNTCTVEVALQSRLVAKLYTSGKGWGGLRGGGKRRDEKKITDSDGCDV